MRSKYCKFCKAGSARWDEKKEGGWKDRMDDWKLQQGNLGPDPDDSNDPDMALYVKSLLNIYICSNTLVKIQSF